MLPSFRRGKHMGSREIFLRPHTGPTCRLPTQNARLDTRSNAGAARSHLELFFTSSAGGTHKPLAPA